ncbi:MAG TPA: DUF4410 domain-containing protein [Gallionella sp.]|nr:DUF4410 domain-containing protein [Gallionella sp.]
MNKRLLSAVTIAFFLAGCASGVKRAPDTAGSHARVSTPSQIASVSVSLTDEAKKKVGENLKFNPDELLNHVKRGLDANSLLGSKDKALPNLEIQVKDMRIRSNFSAVMWGFMAGADSITADIVLKDLAGQELDRYEVSVSYALGGLGGGQDDARMGWLYEKFTEETLKELTKK